MKESVFEFEREYNPALVFRLLNCLKVLNNYCVAMKYRCISVFYKKKIANVYLQTSSICTV